MRDEAQGERPREWHSRQGGITVEGRETACRGSICRYSTKYVNRCTERAEDAGACEPSLRALRGGWVCPSFRILRGHRVLLSSATRRERQRAESRVWRRVSACFCRCLYVERLNARQRLAIKAQWTIALNVFKYADLRDFVSLLGHRA